jgi:hypothetical protein
MCVVGLTIIIACLKNYFPPVIYLSISSFNQFVLLLRLEAAMLLLDDAALFLC